jgi:hypothetical protein
MSCILGLLLASPVMAQDKPEIKLVEHCVTIIICLLGKKVRKNEVEILDTMCSELMPRCLQGNTLNAEYRLYSQGFGGGMLKQGWLGYNLNEKDQIHLV